MAMRSGCAALRYLLPDVEGLFPTGGDTTEVGNHTIVKLLLPHLVPDVLLRVEFGHVRCCLLYTSDAADE